MVVRQSNFVSDGQVIYVANDKILPNPYQPRKNFNSDALQSLAQSIRESGILQPLTIRRIHNSTYYELVAGERRLRASIMAGLPKIPCLIVNIDYQESALYSLLENLQREDLDFFEEAESLSRLISHFSMTQEQVGKKLGKTQSTLSNKLRLLKLPMEIRYFIQSEGLTERHARALLKLPTEKDMWHVLNLIKTRGLNVTQTEIEIEKLINKAPTSQGNTIGIFKDVRIFVNTIKNAVDTMRHAGIDANSVKTETEEYIEFTVRIPKKIERTSA